MKILDIIIGIFTAPFNLIINSRLSRLNFNPYLKAVFIFFIALFITALLILAFYLPQILA